MSRIKELRKSDDNNISLIRIIEQMLVSDKTKYIELFRKTIVNRIESNDARKGIYEDLYQRLPNVSFSDDMDIFELMFLSTLISWADQENIVMFNQFIEYNERTLIERNDLTTYKTFEELSCEISKVDLKMITKEMESQVISLFSDEDWLVIKPLTYDSSKKYGSNTKWCTTSINNPEYFFRYTKNGILIYCINRKTGYKVAAYKDMKEKDISFWNQRDERIDSFYTELPDEILSVLRKELKSCHKPNGLLIEPSLREKEMMKYLKQSQKLSSGDLVEPAPLRRIAIDNRFDYERDDEQPAVLDGGDMAMEERDDNPRGLVPYLTRDQIYEFLTENTEQEGTSNRPMGREVNLDNMVARINNNYDEDRPQIG